MRGPGAADPSVDTAGCVPTPGSGGQAGAS
jgi:hypothetical protein